jgi:hypothetical protein
LGFGDVGRLAARVQIPKLTRTFFNRAEEMDVNKVDLLLKYALAAAGQEDPGNREVGPIHLLKYVYLGDLAYAETHKGETFTGAPWRFHHFGPWAVEVFQRIEPVVNAVGASQRRITRPKLEDDYLRWTLVDDELFEYLNGLLPYEMAVAIRRAVHEFGDDTSGLLHQVYRTRPMLKAAPGELLSFTLQEQEAPDVVRETGPHYDVEPHCPSKREQEIRRSAMQAIRERVQARLTRKKARARRPVGYTPPRYDEVFFDGLKWLDDLGGEAVEGQEGQLSFSESTWKSPARSDSDVS